MSFFAFGYNHDVAPVEIRDGFALSSHDLERLLRATLPSSIAEYVVLSTCNRSEIWLNGLEEDVVALRLAWSEIKGRHWVPEHAFELRDEDAVRHVLSVTSGLESLVLGDAQILAQVKDAYRLAADAGRVGTVLHRLMHTAFRAAKRVATETEVANGAASVSTAAVALARSYFEQNGLHGLNGRHVLLIGAGQMASLAAYALTKQDPASITICSRSLDRATALARAACAEAIPWEERYRAVRGADLVLVATAASEPILEAGSMPAVQTETLVVDISTPRNVDPTIDRVEGYRVYDIDALNKWISQVTDARRSDVPAARAICDEHLSEFVSWMFHQQALQPAIQAIRDTFERIRQREIERHHHRFSEVDREELDLITRSILQKVLAIPIVRLKDSDPESLDFVRGIQILEYLFSRPWCEDSDVTEPAGSITESLPGCPVNLFGEKQEMGELDLPASTTGSADASYLQA